MDPPPYSRISEFLIWYGERMRQLQLSHQTDGENKENIKPNNM
jgi:hypothetical protein